MAKFYEYPSKKLTLGVLNGNGELVSSLEVNDNASDIQDAIDDLKEEISNQNIDRLQQDKDLLYLNVMPDVQYLVDSEKELPFQPTRRSSAQGEYPEAIANPAAPGFEKLILDVKKEQELPNRMHEPIRAFHNLKIKNLTKPITLEDLQSISLADAYIKLGKYIGTQKERFAYNRALDLTESKDPNVRKETQTQVIQKLKSFFEHLFIHTNFKLQKASIPSNLESLDLARMAEIPDKELGKNKKARNEKDGTGVTRNIVDLTWGTSGLALSPFHSLFVRSDPLQMLQTKTTDRAQKDNQTLIPAFYDAVIEEIQYLYNQILHGIDYFDADTQNTIEYPSMLDALVFSNNPSEDFRTRNEIKTLLHESFDEIKIATKYDHVKCVKNSQGRNVWVSAVDGDWSKNPTIRSNIQKLEKILGLNGKTIKVLDKHPNRILLDATLDLLFLYFTKAEIQKCITDNFDEMSSKDAYLEKLNQVFWQYVPETKQSKPKNSYYQSEKRAELPPLDLGLNTNDAADVGCEAVTIATKAGVLHVPNMCSRASIFCQNSCLVVAGQNVVAGSSILGNEYQVKAQDLADNSDSESSADEDNVASILDKTFPGKYRTTKTFTKDEAGKKILASKETKISDYALSKKVMYIRRDLFPYQTRNYARKMYVNLMFLREPLAFCKVLVEVLMKYAVGMDKSKDKLIEKGYLKPIAKQNLPAYYRLNVYSDVPWEVMFPGLFEIFSGQVALQDILHEDDLQNRKFRFGSKDVATINSDGLIPRIQFYDYTKISNRGPYHYEFDAKNSKFSLVDQKTNKKYPTEAAMKVETRKQLKKVDNYHLTFSYSGANVRDSINELEFNNRNVTFAFFRITSTRYENFKNRYTSHLKSLIQRGSQNLSKQETTALENLSKDISTFFTNVQDTVVFPTEFWGYKVIDGDLYDNRTFDRLFRDSSNEAQVVGLKWKFVRVSKSYKLSDPTTTPAAAAFSHLMLGEYKYQQQGDQSTAKNQLFLVNLSTKLWDTEKSLKDLVEKDPTLIQFKSLSDYEQHWDGVINGHFDPEIERAKRLGNTKATEDLEKQKKDKIAEKNSIGIKFYIGGALAAGKPESLVSPIPNLAVNGNPVRDKDYFANLFKIDRDSNLYNDMDVDLPLMRIYYHFKDLQGGSVRDQGKINAYLKYLSSSFVGPVTENGTVMNKVTVNV